MYGCIWSNRAGIAFYAEIQIIFGTVYLFWKEDGENQRNNKEYFKIQKNNVLEDKEYIEPKNTGKGYEQSYIASTRRKKSKVNTKENW